MKTLTLLAAFMVAFLTPTSALAEDPLPEWLEIGTTSGKSVVYARTADLLAGRSHHTTAKLWLKIDASEDTSVAFYETKSLYLINCPAQTYKMLMFTAYDRRGKVISESVERRPTTEMVIPETFMGEAVHLLCTDTSSEEWDT